ncbi:AAA family ATPase, partial [Halobacterium salinarum]|nr:AAA family ATPase [Halobacterium salinarum]
MSGTPVSDTRSTNGAEQRLVVVCGLPGTGKTTVSGHAAETLDAELLRTDVVRTDLFPEPDYT